MVKDLFDTLQAVIEGFGECLVFLSSVIWLGSSKLATRFRVKLLSISTLLYYKSLVHTTTSDGRTNLSLIEEFSLGTLFSGRSSNHLPAKLHSVRTAPCTAP